MKQEVFYIGLNDKDSKTQIVETESAINLVSKLVIEHFGGGTISQARGVYTYKKGEVITENTIRVEVLDNLNSVSSEAFLRKVKELLNQESVFYTSAYIDAKVA